VSQRYSIVNDAFGMWYFSKTDEKHLFDREGARKNTAKDGNVVQPKIKNSTSIFIIPFNLVN
jgi:hypothetical protein